MKEEIYKRRGLAGHIVVHSEEKTFVHNQYKMAFKRKRNLNAHISMHSKANKVICDIYREVYKGKSGLD